MKKLLFLIVLIIASFAIGCAQKETTIHVVYEDSVFKQQILSRIDAIKDSIDSNWKNVYKTDTLYITIHDSIKIIVHDTVKIIIHDTIYIEKSDSIIIPPKDTIIIPPVDTTIVIIPDTIVRHGYFVSNSGDDNNSGDTVTKPWKTLTKALNSGANNIYLKAGDVFKESVALNNKSNIHIDKYGYGKNPIITGGIQLRNWKLVRNNVYKSRISNYLTNVWILKINNRKVPIAIYGRHIITGWNSNTSFTDNNLVGQWTGSDVYVRCVDWISDRVTVSNYANNTFTLSSPLEGGMVGNYYWIVNHPDVLQDNGDWAYSRKDTSIYIYSTGNLNDSLVEISSDLNLITVLNGNNFSIKNVEFTLSNANALFLNQTNNVQIVNCQFDCSVQGIEAINSDNIQIKNSSFDELLEEGVELHSCDYGVIADNIFNNINSKIGEYSISATGRAISVVRTFQNGRWEGCDSTLVYRNKIDRTGSAAITFAGSNRLYVDSNYITNACLLIQDYGAIYNASTSGSTWYGRSAWKGNFIRNNYVDIRNTYSHGLGWTGTIANGGQGISAYPYLLVHGIYCDNGSNKIGISHNVVLGGRNGILLHLNDSVILDGNIVVNDALSALYVSGRGRYLDIRNNKLVALYKNTNSLTHAMRFRESSLLGNTYSNNWYLQPNGNYSFSGFIYYYYNGISEYFTSIPRWEAFSGAKNEHTDVILFTGNILTLDNLYFVYYNETDNPVRLFDIHPTSLRNLDGTNANNDLIMPYIGVIYINN